MGDFSHHQSKIASVNMHQGQDVSGAGRRNIRIFLDIVELFIITWLFMADLFLYCSKNFHIFMFYFDKIITSNIWVKVNVF